MSFTVGQPVQFAAHLRVLASSLDTTAATSIGTARHALATPRETWKEAIHGAKWARGHVQDATRELKSLQLEGVDTAFVGNQFAATLADIRAGLAHLGDANPRPGASIERELARGDHALEAHSLFSAASRRLDAAADAVQFPGLPRFAD